MKQQNNFIDPAVALVAVGVIVAGGLIFIGGPLYNVYAQSQTGRAELARAESNRQIAILESKAKLESAEFLKKSRIIEAESIAESNRIIGASLKNNPEYLTFLQIQNIQEGAEKGNKTYFVSPDQAGVPVLTQPTK